MNISNQNTYVAFERFITTGDANDISFMPSVYLMFAMGSYTFAASTNTFNPQRHFFRLPFQTRVNLINCTSGSGDILDVCERHVCQFSRLLDKNLYDSILPVLATDQCGCVTMPVFSTLIVCIGINDYSANDRACVDNDVIVVDPINSQHWFDLGGMLLDGCVSLLVFRRLSELHQSLFTEWSLSPNILVPIRVPVSK